MLSKIEQIMQGDKFVGVFIDVFIDYLPPLPPVVPRRFWFVSVA